LKGVQAMARVRQPHPDSSASTPTNYHTVACEHATIL